MGQLKTTDGAATFGANALSQVFGCGGGVLDVYISGTAHTNTLALKICRTEDGTFNDYYIDDLTGTPAAQTFTVTEVPAGAMFHLCLKEHGMFFQFSTNGTGSPSWEIDVNGPHVTGVQ